MVDFKKKLGKKIEKKPLSPAEIYDTLDRASDKGPLRPAQLAVLSDWHDRRRTEKDVILKLHTGQGKTLIGLLILQSKLNEGKGPSLYLCPNNFLITQTCEQAAQFGVAFSIIENDIPDTFVDSKTILITSVQRLFNGLTKFGTGARSLSVGSLVMDDAHACIDTIKEQVSIKLTYDSSAYAELVELFGSGLKDQGLGTYSDLLRHEDDAILPVPYWEWMDKVGDVASILSRHTDQNSVKFAWPLLKDMLEDCQCVMSGTGLEVTPYLPPLHHFGSFFKASHRVFMSATVTDDSFLVKGLRLPSVVIKSPIVYDKEKWSGEKMILIPSLIDETLGRSTIVEMFAKPSDARKYGVVALCPSFKGTQDWQAYGADIAKTETIESKIANLKAGFYKQALVIVNRYDGIDLPDNSCRVLILDSRPYSESILDRYMERCLGNSDAIAMKTARKIEQGLGRSVRGEKDYCVIVLTGTELVKEVRTTTSRRFFSAQTRTQIEIGLELAEFAKEEGQEPLKAFVGLIAQSLRRDDGWKEFYVEKMNEMLEHGPHHERLNIFALELQAEQRAESGQYDEAVEIIQKLCDQFISDDAERGWYLQEMGRLVYRSSKTKSNQYQIGAHKRNRYLLKPREGMVFQKIAPLSQKRVDTIIDKIHRFKSYEDLALAVHEITSKLTFGVDADSFEQVIDELGKLLGFACERPDKEWKEGPDNIWCLREGEYLLFECKSEVQTTRAEISKYESEQMNSSAAWFQKNYPGSKVRNLLIHPAKKLGGAAAFLQDVDVVRKAGLEKLANNVRSFFGEFKNIDLKDLSPAQVQTFLDTHGLGVQDFGAKYGERIRNI